MNKLVGPLSKRYAIRHFLIQDQDIALWLIVSIRFQVLFHSPLRGAFHLSLTVLVHYRSPKVFSFSEWAPMIHTGFLGSRATQGHQFETTCFSNTGLSPSMVALSRDILLNSCFVTQFQSCRYWILGLTTPRIATAATYHAIRVWAFPLSLAATRGIISFPRGTKMFQFPHLPPSYLLFL